jgi:hypothetical protein
LASDTVYKNCAHVIYFTSDRTPIRESSPDFPSRSRADRAKPRISESSPPVEPPSRSVNTPPPRPRVETSRVETPKSNPPSRATGSRRAVDL